MTIVKPVDAHSPNNCIEVEIGGSMIMLNLQRLLDRQSQEEPQFFVLIAELKGGDGLELLEVRL